MHLFNVSVGVQGSGSCAACFFLQGCGGADNLLQLAIFIRPPVYQYLSTSIEELLGLNGNSDSFLFTVDKTCSNSACLRSPCISSLRESGVMGHGGPGEPNTHFL